MIFRDRDEAALQLVQLLSRYKDTDSVVLALPRGGVPVGKIIAKALHLPMDIVLTKKIGHPNNSEYAIGSVSLFDHYLNPGVSVPEEYINEEVKKIRATLQERLKQYKGHASPVPLEGKNVILVDDGIATGTTMIASIALIRKCNPKSIIVAVPVAPPDTARRIKALADEFICPYTPSDFLGVGQFYEDFRQIEDKEVVELMKE